MNKKLHYIIMAIFIIIISGLIFALIWVTNEDNKMQDKLKEYCQTNGYDSFEIEGNKLLKGMKIRCYKKINEEIGYSKEYSGILEADYWGNIK